MACGKGDRRGQGRRAGAAPALWATSAPVTTYGFVSFSARCAAGGMVVCAITPVEIPDRMTEERPATGATAREGLPWLPALAFFLVLTAYYVIRPVRDQLIGAVGSTALPSFYLAVFVVTLLLAPLFGYMVSRFGRARLLAYSYSFFIACLLAFVPAFLAQDRIGARNLGIVFFVWTTVFNVFVVSLFWSFMADIYDSVRARAVFPIIAMGGMGGALFGPVVPSTLVSVVGVAPLLVVSATMLS